MSTITISISGATETALALGKVTIPVLTRKPMTRSMIRLQGEMASYPPQRPATNYVRTGTLGRRWTWAVSTVGTGLQGKIGNNVSYAPFVQSKRFQAAVHRGRWQTDEDVLKQQMPAIIRDFEQGIRVTIRELGLG